MDHLSSNILMCAMLLLFYASGTVKGVAFGGACSSNGDCTEYNNECSTKCACNSVTFRNTANDACVTKVVLEAVCTDGEPAGQCVDNLAECRDESEFRCLCKAANYKGSSACEVRKAPDAACSTGECVTNAKCNASDKCACNTGYTATPTTSPTSCQSSDAAIIIAHMYVFIFGIVASLYFLV